MKGFLILLILLYLSFFNIALAANPLDVAVNEIAWMGTANSAQDEWIELYNNTNQEINLDGWALKAADGTPEIKLTGNIPASGFYLLERSKDYTGALENGGEILGLYDELVSLIDKVEASSGWPAGDNTTKQTMERRLAAPGTTNWQTSAATGGTPMAGNSFVPQKAAEAGSPPVPSEDKPPISPKINDEPRGVEEKLPKNFSASLPFLAAIFTSFSGGVIILLLKKKLT